MSYLYKDSHWEQYVYSYCDNKDPLVIAIEENPKSFKEVYAETPAAKSHKKED